MLLLGFANRKLTHSSLEYAFSDAGAFVRSGIWTEQARDNGVFVDLSQVEWCDLSATVRLVLFIERALKDGLTVRVALPLPHPRQSEQGSSIERYEQEYQNYSSQQIRKRIDRRSRSLEFLQHIHFIEAIGCSHLHLEADRLIILDSYDGSSVAESTDRLDEVGDSSSEEDIYESHERTYNFIFPLQWFSEIDLERVRDDLGKLQTFLGNVVSHNSGGISKFDPEAIANVIFHELIQNTLVHADTSHCLIGAWCRKPDLRVNLDDYDAQEESFFSEWIEPNKLPWVDIAIGDSGKGIPASLGEAFDRELGNKEGVPDLVSSSESQILFWSLGRWSSSNNPESERRGTRGLYRVHRLVKAYNGSISLRSETAWAGWEHGGYDRHEPLEQHDLDWSPGTFISIKLPSLTQIHPPLLSPPVQNREIDFTFAESLVIKPEGLTPETLQKLGKKLANGSTAKHRCVIAWLAKIPDNGDIERRKEGIEKALNQLSELVNPGSLVVIAPIVSPDEIDTYIDSVNQQISKDNPIHDIAANPNDTDIVDLFSLIDRNFKTYWIGGQREELDIINALHECKEAKLSANEIEKYLPKKHNEREYVLQDFRQQPSLIQFDGDGVIKLRFNTHNVLDFIDNAVCSRLQNLLEVSTDQGVGVLAGGIYLSPSLVYTRKWLDLDVFFKRFGWFEVTEESFQTLDGQNLPENLRQTLERSIGSEFFTTESVRDCLNIDRTVEWENVVLPELLKSQDVNIIFFALSSKINQLASKIQQDEFRIDYVVCDSHSNKNHVRMLNEFLSIANKPIVLPRIMLAGGESRDIWDDLKGKNILIYVDIISSGNASRQLLEQVLRKGAKPVAIACLFDSRDYQDKSQLPVICMGNEVDVVPLIQSKGLLKNNITDVEVIEPKVINALTDKPERFDDKVLELNYSITPARILDFIKATDALYFNHIRRVSSNNSIHNKYNHFTFYLDINKLLTNNECISVTAQAFNDELNNFIRDVNQINIPASLDNLQVLYLANDEIKPKNVSALFQRLGIEPNAVNLGVLNWGLLSDDTFEGKDVVVFDWNAMTGRTVHRLVDSIAAKGARSVLAVVWLSRMPADEEQLLRGLTQIRAVQQIENRASDLFAWDLVRQQNIEEVRNVPIRIRFLSSVKISIYDEHTCPICRQKERIYTENGEAERYPTQLIRNFATEQMGLFRPKDIEDLRTELRIDADGTRQGISADQAVMMLGFQQDLEAAVLRTSYRKKIKEFLLDLLDRLKQKEQTSLTEASSLVWLLAIELQWVKLPPLDFQNLREILVQIVIYVLYNIKDERVIQYAIIVLRSTDKNQFAIELPNLVRRFSKKAQLLKQLLYDTFTFLDAKHHEHTIYPERIFRSLQDILEIIKPRENEVNNELSEIYSTVQTLQAIAKRKLAFTTYNNMGSTSLINSWIKLRIFLEGQFSTQHGDILTTIKNLYNGSSYEKEWEDTKDDIADTSFWEIAKQHWFSCQILLEDEVFPLVRQTQKIFQGPQSSRYFKEAEKEFLREICTDIDSSTLIKFNNILTGFCVHPPSSTSNEWADFKRIRENLEKTLLGYLNDDNKFTSLLYKFVQDCPVDIVKLTKDFISQKKWKNSAKKINIDVSKKKLLVFCHKGLLNAIFTELFDNATNIHKIPEKDVYIKIFISYDTEKQKTRLVFFNSGSNPDLDNRTTFTRKNGLFRLKTSLEPYEATLNHHIYNGKEWDYQTNIVFQNGD